MVMGVKVRGGEITSDSDGGREGGERGRVSGE